MSLVVGTKVVATIPFVVGVDQFYAQFDLQAVANMDSLISEYCSTSVSSINKTSLERYRMGEGFCIIIMANSTILYNQG